MDNNILSTLNEIKVAVYVLLAIVSLGVIANWVRAWISVKKLVKKALDDIFTTDAENYYDDGKFDELLSHCEEKLKSKPNHSYALWYKAKAYYRKHEYEQSRKFFEQLDAIEPSWSASHVQPFLEKIRAIENENR